jgi:hypothetical protein
MIMTVARSMNQLSNVNTASADVLQSLGIEDGVNNHTGRQDKPYIDKTKGLSTILTNKQVGGIFLLF